MSLQPVGIYPKKYEWAASVVGMHMLGIQSPNIGGDCSLWVRSATIEFDNGHWECQVTSSDFTTQDALTSQPVRLVVRSKCGTRLSCFLCVFLCVGIDDEGTQISSYRGDTPQHY